MTLGYRSYFEVVVPDGIDVVSCAAREIRSWLELKGRRRPWDPAPSWLRPGVYALSEHDEYLVADEDDGRGQRRFRFRLDEHGEAGRWRTTVSVLSATAGRRARHHVWVDLDVPDEDDPQRPGAGGGAWGRGRGGGIAVPGVVHRLLDRFEARNGRARLRSEPCLVHGEDPGTSEALRRILADGTRTVGVVVVGPMPSADHTLLAAWRQAAGSLFHHTVGLNAVYLLDEPALESVNAWLGASHRLAPGSARTFEAGVVPGDRDDSRRHRILTPETITRNLRLCGRRFRASPRLTEVLAATARRRILDAGLPRELTRAASLLARREADVALDCALSLHRSVARRETRGGGVVAPRHGGAGARAAGRAAAARAASGHSAYSGPSGYPGRGGHASSAASLVPASTSAPAPARPRAASGTEPAGAWPVALIERSSPTPAPAEAPAPAPASAPAVSGADLELLGAVRRLLGERLGVDSPTAADVEILGQLLQETDRSIDMLKTNAMDLRETIESVEAKRREAHARLESSELEHLVTLDELERSRRQVRYLQAELGRAARAYAEPPAEEFPPPDSFPDLVTILKETDPARRPAVLARVRFTGDEADTLKLEPHDTAGVNVFQTWQILLVLADFAEARAAGQWHGGVHGYLKEPPPGRRTWSPTKHAATESETVRTNSRMRQQRTLRVPTEVDPSGYVFMEAHFKIAQRDTVAPRLHYYDDTARSGRVYVGYIGPHLTNTRS
ncbi:hypothetical protein [Allostreptomyces psammosilenae]|uniref:Uncharacterized protein n=1 Tax=Allostreptomyces psammosilenae TaxID=1892865 RepID=A0A853A9X6_9ACTN|nr:hypothetical protein [Allostreptomyces psammosilenae]NYI07192.1 hypothetical protein [Allostreptomyces psammosilenae]